ncbi:MAG: DEAD/DEAH box helicase [Nitrospirae bacterium]|nr:DEAD/DEAH box helicase [Nitrospirota bacterium]
MRFEDFALSRETLRTISKIGFEEPTPIQVAAIPLVTKGIDVIGQAQTGTGKTAAFGIPIVEAQKRGKRPFAIVMEPTRELAVQVAQELNKIGSGRQVHVFPVYGGKSMENQIRTLRTGVDVVVGTPGRILDHIRRRTLSLADIRIVVLDEADEMLDMGFIEDIETILKSTPAERQTLLFSATMPQAILNISKKYMRTPEKIRINPKDVVVPEIKQVFYEVRDADKINALTRLIDVEDPQLAIVFCHTKRDVDDVAMKLQEMGYNANALHGDFTQAHRDEVMDKFKKGDLDILVATDVAARGLDIKNVTHVINFSIPQNPDSYIHRIGRTGRAGRSGIAITLVTPREYRHLRLIEKTAKTTIDKRKLPSQKEVLKAKEKSITREIAEILAGKKHEGYMRTVEGLAGDHSLADVAAAALCLAYGEPRVAPVEEPLERGGGGTARLFMTIGRKDKISASSIVKAIASGARIPGSKIGKIDVRDSFTFVEVPADLADMVIHSLDDVMMLGRRVSVKQAKARKK